MQEHSHVKAALMARAEELVAAQGDYGRIVSEFASSLPLGEGGKQRLADGEYVGAWDCETIE